jgi:hypothetical protein
VSDHFFRLNMSGRTFTCAADRNQVVTPPSVEPTLIIPELGSPGLFGPPSESSTDQWMPPRPPVEPRVAVLGRGSPGLFGLPSESTNWKNKPPGFPRSPPGTEMPPLPMPDTPQMRGWAAWARE